MMLVHDRPAPVDLAQANRQTEIERDSATVGRSLFMSNATGSGWAG